MNKWLKVNATGANAYFRIICGKASSSQSDYCPNYGAKNDEIIGGIAGERAKKREEKMTKCKKI